MSPFVGSTVYVYAPAVEDTFPPKSTMPITGQEASAEPISLVKMNIDRAVIVTDDPKLIGDVHVHTSLLVVRVSVIPLEMSTRAYPPPVTSV
jgi:hypothetical protein